MAPQIPFKFFALQRTFAEALAEEVLGPVASPVAAIPRNRNHHFLISLVVAKDLLKAVTQVVEVFVLRNAAFEDAWFYFQGGRGLDERADIALSLVDSHVGILFFEYAAIVVFEASEVGLAASSH